MNIENRAQFDALLVDFEAANTVVIDTETNGLSVFEGHPSP